MRPRQDGLDVQLHCAAAVAGHIVIYHSRPGFARAFGTDAHHPGLAVLERRRRFLEDDASRATSSDPAGYSSILFNNGLITRLTRGGQLTVHYKGDGKGFFIQREALGLFQKLIKHGSNNFPAPASYSGCELS